MKPKGGWLESAEFRCSVVLACMQVEECAKEYEQVYLPELQRRQQVCSAVEHVLQPHAAQLHTLQQSPAAAECTGVQRRCAVVQVKQQEELKRQQANLERMKLDIPQRQVGP